MLFEREAELIAIEGTLAAAMGGEGRSLIFEGPAGIGKTTLLTTAADRARELGLTVLVAQGGEFEGAFPYGVARQLFEPLLLAGDEEERGRLLAGPAALAAPALSDEPGEAGTPAAPFALVRGLYWLVANLADRGPVALMVDDAHWSDAPSLRWLVYLARRLDGLAVAMLVSLRRGEEGVDGPVRDGLRAAVAQVVVPTTLSEAAVATVLEVDLGRAPTPELARACHVATDGNPFFVHELASSLRASRIDLDTEASAIVRETGPPAIARTTLIRLARISDEAVALARATAVLGGDANLPRAATLAGLDEEEALRALDALVTTGLAASGGRLGFAHPIVRAAIYEELRPGDRSIAHRRAASLLADEGAPIDAVAGHLLPVEPTGSAATIATLRGAADHALAVGAPESACGYLARALEEGCDRRIRTALLLDLATAQKLARDPAALATLREAHRLAEDALTRATALVEQSDLLAYAGEWEAAKAVLDGTLAELGDDAPEPALRARTLRALMSSYDPRLVGDFDRDLPDLLALARSGAPGTRPLAQILAGVLVQRGEDPELVRSLVAHGWDEGRGLVDRDGVETLPQLLVALVALEDFERATASIEAVASFGRDRGSVLHFLLARGHDALVENRRGDLAAAADDLRVIFEMTTELGMSFVTLLMMGYCADALLERPEVADIADLALGVEIGPLAEVGTGAMVAVVRARLEHAAGHAEEAIAQMRRAGAIAGALRFEHPCSLLAWRSTLAPMLPAADRAEALELVDADLETARRVGSATAVGVALRAQGIVLGGEEGLARLEEAADLLARSPARLEHARALVEMGAALRRSGARSRARDPLREGLDLAERCGAVRLAERGRVELAASGARPRRSRLRGPASLTPSELRVARLAAEGRTSREIAQALFVTRKTVDTHLGHVYAKLGIDSRRALGDALLEGDATTSADPT